MEFIISDNNKITILPSGEEFTLYEILLDFVNNTVFGKNIIIFGKSERYLRELIYGYTELNKDFSNLQGILKVLYPAYQDYLSEKDTITKELSELDSEAERLLKIETKESILELDELQDDIINLIESLFIDKNYQPDFGGIDVEVILRIGYYAPERRIYESYIIDDIEKYCFFAISELSNLGMTIKKCHNCGRYFVPLTRSDEIYCDSEYTNGRTCKQIGYENKIKNDDILSEYRRVYKNKNALKQRTKNKNPNAEKDFKNWVYAAKLKLDDCQDGNITIDQFKEWLKSN
jgi:hypothetical protein